jgi:hypothetical protein
MFEPILQLKALRYRFLLIRELCLRSSDFDVRASYFREAALLGWRASRLIGGWLHSHPNIQNHPKDSAVRRLVVQAHALLVGLPHFTVLQRTVWLHGQLALASQACANICAVTSSVAINDILGRRQPEIAHLMRATAAAAATTAGPRATVAATSSGGEENWPFLSI